jgi:hypothetical protein
MCADRVQLQVRRPQVSTFDNVSGSLASPLCWGQCRLVATGWPDDAKHLLRRPQSHPQLRNRFSTVISLGIGISVPAGAGAAGAWDSEMLLAENEFTGGALYRGRDMGTVETALASSLETARAIPRPLR